MNALLMCVVLLGGVQVENFADNIGDVKIGPVANTGFINVPYITWGGDVATFVANGGLKTKSGSTFDKYGLKLNLTAGDDFHQQVRDYLSGKTPFLRGTFSMLGQASELLNRDPNTKPVMVLQLTWSLGDHMVARENIKNLNDLKGKTICLQKGGPHIGLVDDAIRAAGIKWDDINIVWAKNLTGADSPAEMIRKNNSIDVACVISPDMIGLTGGLDQKGNGAEGTLKGGHVVVSTAQMSRSIADVYVVRADYFKAHKDVVQKFVAGYLKGAEELVMGRKDYADGKGKSASYLNALKMAQTIYGTEVLPTIEVDAHGLVSDANFVGLTGNVAFFNDKGNLNGFDAKQKATLNLMTTLGFVKTRAGFETAHWDYPELAQLAGIEYTAPKAQQNRIKAEGIDVFPDSDLDERTILTFTINFEPNQEEFSVDTYGAEFQRVVQSASTFGNAAIVVRGHADPTKTLIDFVRAGMNKGIIKRDGPKGNYKYSLNGKPFDLASTKDVIEAIDQGSFSGSIPNPQDTVTGALNLSLKRAEAVQRAIIDYAKQNGLNLDESQIRPSGVGIREPLIPKPANAEQAKQNMRVEFRLIRVTPEAINASDFDF